MSKPYTIHVIFNQEDDATVQNEKAYWDSITEGQLVNREDNYMFFLGWRFSNDGQENPYIAEIINRTNKEPIFILVGLTPEHPSHPDPSTGETYIVLVYQPRNISSLQNIYTFFDNNKNHISEGDMQTLNELSTEDGNGNGNGNGFFDFNLRWLFWLSLGIFVLGRSSKN